MDRSCSFPHSRLRRLGAASLELAQMRKGWRAMDEEQQRAAAAELEAMSDKDLREGIADIRKALKEARGG